MITSEDSLGCNMSINFTKNVARVFKCVDENYLQVIEAGGWTQLPAFDPARYIQMSVIPLAELDEPFDAVSWFFEVSNSRSWADKRINPLTIGDVVTIKDQAFMYVPKDLEESLELAISTKLSMKEIPLHV